jgi:hypothetical protein
MSRVTVVPTSAAAAQIFAALSVLIAGPSCGSDWPSADSFTDTSARPASPSPPSRCSNATYASVVCSVPARSRVCSPR